MGSQSVVLFISLLVLYVAFMFVFLCIPLEPS